MVLLKARINVTNFWTLLAFQNSFPKIKQFTHARVYPLAFQIPND